jgi:hypothetical protein
MEWGVSRSVMQKTLRKLMEDGLVTRLKIVERDDSGKAKQNTVYIKVEYFEGDDGFGNVAGNCGTCGSKMQVVRPGKFQCAKCE